MPLVLSTTYDPRAVEDRTYQRWESGGAFASTVRQDRRPYCIVIPPPNVTGALHIGHALNNTLQDLLIRYHRMQGDEAMWLPGTDHAGIATQNVVEREIYAKEKKTRHDIGREELIRRIWQWREQYGDRIIDQLRRIGSSCDWARMRFTMDEGLSRAVREVFVRLFREGLIYRGRYIVNWCVRCRTALSDDEVEPEDAKGHLWHIRYPLKGDPSKGIVVATTRPETMLGDTAVAVHPEDERYRGWIGKTVVLPLANREIPVIADTAVEKGFGTGAVKVTPAHDRDDFMIGQRHGLPQVMAMDEDGKMTEAAGPYRGLDRHECRERAVADLAAQGLLVKIEDHPHSVGHCYRCHKAVEPYLSLQWFVKMKPLAELAIRATEERRVVFHPERWEKVYLNWLRDVRDWCISRQIWWGHRIPVFYCDEPGCGSMTAEIEDIAECPKCGSKKVRQDEDVLDTWFSSDLWPFSTLGWPSRTPELEFYYPTDTLVTARGIIYLWVARMVMMGEKFMGREPFRHVYIHGTVLDDQGRIMSKSLGNGIDPLEVVRDYGADALRFCLTQMTTEGQDLRLSIKRFEDGRNFANKVWNATRFCLMALEGPGKEMARLEGPADLRFEDRWILSRAYSTLDRATAALDEFKFHEACEALYHFFWDEFCAWYIELVKDRVKGDSADVRDAAVARRVLAHVLDMNLRMLHPVCPYVTEELWGHLNATVANRSLTGDGPAPSEMLIRASWPKGQPGVIDEELEAEAKILFDAITMIRTYRSETQAPRSKPLDVAVVPKDASARRVLGGQLQLIRSLAAAEVKLAEDGQAASGGQVKRVTAAFEMHLPAPEKEKLGAERKKLQKEIERIGAYAEKLRGKLGDGNYLGRAPAAVVEADRKRLAEAEENLRSLREHMESLGGAD